MRNRPVATLRSSVAVKGFILTLGYVLVGGLVRRGGGQRSCKRWHAMYARNNFRAYMAICGSLKCGAPAWKAGQQAATAPSLRGSLAPSSKPSG